MLRCLGFHQVGVFNTENSYLALLETVLRAILMLASGWRVRVVQGNTTRWIARVAVLHTGQQHHSCGLRDCLFIYQFGLGLEKWRRLFGWFWSFYWLWLSSKLVLGGGGGISMEREAQIRRCRSATFLIRQTNPIFSYRGNPPYW